MIPHSPPLMVPETLLMRVFEMPFLGLVLIVRFDQVKPTGEFSGTTAL